MDIKRFQKRVEDFDCERCGHTNKGTGFSNHCSECLISKHVDIFPGDRKESCGGIMDVTGIQKKGERYVLEHTCTTCKKTSGDHFRERDNFDTLIKLVAKINARNENSL